MKDLTVFVLTHNRGMLLLETVESIINQNCADFKFIVSDNSDNDKTYELLKQHNMLDRFDYRKRGKLYSSLEHFNLCLSEVDTKYFILFHDDDIMLPNMVDVLYNAINGSEYAAVGCNAYIMNNVIKTTRRFLKEKKNTELNTKNLVYHYCTYNIVPFPSYIYSHGLLNGLDFGNDCGKYSDVSWLLQLSKISKILWLSDCLFYYRVHTAQDSNYYDIVGQKKLFNLFVNELDEIDLLKNYYANMMYSELYTIKKVTKKTDLEKFKKLYKLSKLYTLKYLIKLLSSCFK